MSLEGAEGSERRRPRNDDGARRCLLTLCDRAFYSVHPTTATAMQGYNPAPPPAGTPVHHQQVAQHLAANIPGFGDPTGLKFRGAVRATTAFGHPPPGGVAAAPAPAAPNVGGYAPPAYAAAPAHSAPAYYGAPAAGAPVSLPWTRRSPFSVKRPACMLSLESVRPFALQVAATAVVAASATTTGAPAAASLGAPAAASLGAPPAYAPAYPAAQPQSAGGGGAAAAAALIEAPTDFTCPITQEIMVRTKHLSAPGLVAALCTRNS
jgi:hypothetical protein